jgi:hypothetical protein
MHFGRVCVIGVAALLAAAPCLAQDAMPDRTTTKREKVFVTLVDAEDELHGRLLRLDSRSLSIEVEKRRVDLPLHRVLKIEKKVNDTVLDGALLLGLFVAACAKWWCAQGTSSGPNLPEDIYIGFGVGALAGAGLDSQIYRRSVIFTAGEVRQSEPVRAAISLRVRF